MTYNPTDIFSQIDLLNVTNSSRIDTDIIIRGELIKTLGEVEKINGFLGISDSSIESLGNLKRIKKDFWIGSYTVRSQLTSLNNLEYVGGDLNLRYSNIKNLGRLKKVGGKLSLRDTEIQDLGHLEYVGGDLYLPKKVENLIELSNVEVQGRIRFWNDSKTKKDIAAKSELGLANYHKQIPEWCHKYIHYFREIKDASLPQKKFYKEYKKYFLNGEYIDVKGNNNYTFILFYDLLENHSQDLKLLQQHLKNLEKYYPITKGYTSSALIQELENNKNFEKAWKLTYQKEYIGFENIIEFEDKLGRELLDGELIVKLAGYSHLTEFGQNNIKAIKSITSSELLKYKAENKAKFFELFLKNNEPIESKKERETYHYDPEYYKRFFLSNSEYLHYKAIDDNQLQSKYFRKIPHVVEKAIYNQLRLILKNAEDSYREEIGMPKVGEGWISETELFYKISDYFEDLKVVHHASPKWLGRQHLDIFIPKFKIGIEYQGEQHYQPIDFFGGQEAFEKTVERDKRKKQICKNNNCSLIYVEKGYDIDMVVLQIKREINGVQQRI